LSGHHSARRKLPELVGRQKRLTEKERSVEEKQRQKEKKCHHQTALLHG
jgi:hypothetical protein